MLVKPNTAFTGVPSDRFIGGRAWKARKMNPDPSMRIRCEAASDRPVASASASGSAMAASAMSVPVVVPGPGHEPEDARTIGAEGLLVDDVEPDPRMPERTIAAVARHDPPVDHDDLGLADVEARRG